MKQLNIWDLEDYQCPIVGTCLTMADLDVVARQAGVAIDDDATDFEKHGFFVSQAKCPGRVGKAVQQRLNSRHRKSLKRFRPLDGDDALRAEWRRCADAGDIPGPFWAVLSHPRASPGLRHELFGEVHMLSHVLGAANHADLKRLAAMEREIARLQRARAEGKSVLRKAVAVWKRRCRELTRQLETERREHALHAAHRTDLDTVLKDTADTVLGMERDALATQGAQSAADLLQAESVLERQAATIEELTRQVDGLRTALAERDETVAVLEGTLARTMEHAGTPSAPDARAHATPASGHSACAGDDDHACTGACGGDCADCPRLSGKCVLYVGGRCNLAPHYKALAKRHGCELLLHDGGVEQSPHRLQQLLTRADAVICPVTCVSHEACSLVKRTCKGCLKPLALPTSSGLGGLARSLCELEKAVQ